jgi:EAL domain-containing protein (putative c-di-GMP-specific phosphodiesterase class I)/GGDEF domain-containing protein
MKKALYILLFIFVLSLLSFFYLQKEYIDKSVDNYIKTIQYEINILIQTKQKNTFEIAKNLAIDKNLIKIIKEDKYDILYKTHFFAIADEYKNFKHIGIHIIDKKGIQKYVSWSKKSLGKNILKARPDLAEIIKNPKPTSIISSGLFDLTFKGIVPIFDKNHNFLAILEVVTHFNSIEKKLKEQNIYSAVILNKEKSKHIKYNFFGEFIDGYFISNINLDKNIEYNLKKYGIKKFINIPYNSYNYIPTKNDLFDGYYVINIPIYMNNTKIANYIAFAYDTHKLKEKEIALYLIMLLITILFILTGLIAYKQTKQNEKLIASLNQEVQKQISDKLKLIYIDPLTKAYKKTKFEIDKINYLEYKVVMLNIKNFSKINELYGFKTGDELLKIVTKRVENLINNKIYRINADEFVFFSKNIKKDIFNIKQSFINNPIKLSKSNINIRLTFNFSVTNNEGSEILRKLSIALKESKQKPFQDFVFYQEKPLQTDFIKFNSLLYDAIFINDNSSITPYFQGINDNKTNKIYKYECLARLETKDKVYSPYFFIDIAKSSGFLFEITKIMIDKSFKYISDKPNIEISINITEDDLFTYQLSQYLIDKLEKYQIQANRITLEILEGITSNGTKNNIIQLKELKNIGFKLAIDDFGVEYSNFERIQELDIDFIKIDGKYIKNLNTNKKSYETTKAIVNFAHSLDIKVVAEFVENEEIQNIVKELGIEYSQGYFFSQPKKEIEV